MLERHKLSGRTAFWNNYRLIRATTWREAFRAASALSSEIATAQVNAFGETCMFIGITDLVPIYEAFENGSEILWEEYDASNCEDSNLPLDIYSESEMEAIYEKETGHS